MLVLRDFTNIFVLECDTLGKCIRAAFMQEGWPSVFTSKQLCERHLGKSTYKKEMMATLDIVDVWCPYLFGKSFQIKTDHFSLKYFME
jgi:hypothetical protein